MQTFTQSTFGQLVNCPYNPVVRIRHNQTQHNTNIRQHTPEVMQPISNDILLRTTHHVFLPFSVFLTSSATHGPQTPVHWCAVACSCWGIETDAMNISNFYEVLYTYLFFFILGVAVSNLEYLSCSIYLQSRYINTRLELLTLDSTGNRYSEVVMPIQMQVTKY